LRILYWSELFWPYVGGPELFARRLLPALRDRGYEIVVVSSHDHFDLPDRSQLDGMTVHRFFMRAALASGNVEQLANVLGQIRQFKRDVAPDVVHVSGVGPSAFFHLLTEASHPAPCLVSIRTEVLDSQKEQTGSILEKTLHRADWVTAVSSRVLQQARQLAPAIADRSSVVYNFIDVPDRRPTPPPIAPPRVVCLGRLIPAKGFDLALKAFPAVLGRCPQARLVIAGEGPEKPDLERLACRVGVDQAVRFAGPVAPRDIPDLLESATLVVVPSRREGLSMVAIEAGMMARPVVATDTGGLPEVILNGHTGLLVPKEDVNALAEAISALLGQPATAARMGRRARDRVQAVFARDRTVEAYSQIYQRLGCAGGTTIRALSRAGSKENDDGRVLPALS
jgi:glycosyltransferase involved in cell wall biosynthesis